MDIQRIYPAFLELSFCFPLRMRLDQYLGQYQCGEQRTWEHLLRPFMQERVSSCLCFNGNEVGGDAGIVDFVVSLPVKTVASGTNCRNDLLTDDQYYSFFPVLSKWWILLVATGWPVSVCRREWILVACRTIHLLKNMRRCLFHYGDGSALCEGMWEGAASLNSFSGLH